MKIKRLNQKGFGALEVLLLLVIVGIIGGAGWYVYQSQKKTNESLDKANQNIETIAQNKKTTEKATEKPNDSVKHVDIPELGIRVTFDEADKVSYKLQTGNCSLVPITDTKCNKSAQFLFVNKELEKKCTSVGVSVYEFSQQPEGISSTKVGSKYYSINGAPGNCEDEVSGKLGQAITTSLSNAKISAL
jgi:uncharacterized protein (UPF0333 family)